MSLPTYYPPADHQSQWFGTRSPWVGGGVFSTVEKLLLHTTESADWPSYPNFAPNLTYNPWSHRWRQHMPLTRSATTLEDPSSTTVRENRDHVIQVEIVAYCDPNTYKRYGHDIHTIDDQALKDLGMFARWLHNNGGLKLDSSVVWKDYPASYGADNGIRLSGPQFDAYKGILGHQHTSGNHHGDPGKINIKAILDHARVNDTVTLWTLRHAEAWDGSKTRRPDLDLPANVKRTGVVDHDYANDGRYFCIGAEPHRVWYALDNGDWARSKGGTPLGS